MASRLPWRLSNPTIVIPSDKPRRPWNNAIAIANRVVRLVVNARIGPYE
jgi:hypothetical protein